MWPRRRSGQQRVRAAKRIHVDHHLHATLELERRRGLGGVNAELSSLFAAFFDVQTEKLSVVEGGHREVSATGTPPQLGGRAVCVHDIPPRGPPW